MMAVRRSRRGLRNNKHPSCRFPLFAGIIIRPRLQLKGPPPSAAKTKGSRGSSSKKPSKERIKMSPQAGFVLQDQVVPRHRSAIPTVCHCVGSEDAQELIQDSIALAARLMHNVEAQGKTVNPGNIAYYTIQHIKSGRRSTGRSLRVRHAIKGKY